MTGTIQAYVVDFAERKTPVKTSRTIPQSETPRLYHTTRGLRSIPYIILSETGMTETCALHLSYVIPQHCTPEQLLQRVPPAKPGAPTQQLVAYELEVKCQGIVYYPNAMLGSAGTKVLHLSEMVRKGLLNEMNEASSEASPLPTRGSSSARRISDSRSNPLTNGNRRRSGTPGAGQDQNGSEMRTTTSELEKARHRIQGATLRDAGPLSNELWRTSLKMLCVCRGLCPCTEDEPTPATDNKKEVQTVENSGPENLIAATESSLASTTTAPPVTKPTPLAYRNPNQPLTLRLGQEWRNGKLVLTPILPSPTTPTVIAPPAPPLPSPPPPEAPKVPYRTNLPCGFTADTWRRIVAYAIDTNGIMSGTQQEAMVRWAMDRRTLAQEKESLGKPQSAQIWKVLDATGCLAYEMRV